MNISKKGQMGILVVLGIVVISAVIVYLIARDKFVGEPVDAEISKVFEYYQGCIEDETLAAASLAGTQGGRVYLSEYIPGSEYAPSSSQLNFMGFGVEYWNYVSQNGIIRESVPTKAGLEKEISKYIKENIPTCDFREFYELGYYINFSTPSVTVKVEDEIISVKVSATLGVSKGETSAQKKSHEVNVESRLGKMFSLAREVYDYERQSSFLENYTIDVLRSYAPVDGVEIGCSPKTWITRDVINNLSWALEANIATLKFLGSDYSIRDASRNYFVIPHRVDMPIRLLTSSGWPSKYEIIGADDELMVAKPVGTQAGMGVMGFCYSPYHFVYNIQYPVMFQIIEGDEIFQFPIVVVIDRNVPREASENTLVEQEIGEDICKDQVNDVEIRIFDSELNGVNADVSYTCFDQQCNLGKSRDGKIVAKIPSCLNGFIQAEAEGYTSKSKVFSSNKESYAEVFLEKEYPVEVQLVVGGRELKGTAIVTFNGPSNNNVYLPEANKTNLAEGMYNISIFAYTNSTLIIPSSTKTQCQEVASGGILGLFGSTREECFEIEIPQTTLESALIGGGKSEVYLLGENLKKGKIKLSVPSLPVPNSIEQLQYNFESVEQQNVEVIE